MNWQAAVVALLCGAWPSIALGGHRRQSLSHWPGLGFRQPRDAGQSRRRPVRHSRHQNAQRREFESVSVRKCAPCAQASAESFPIVSAGATRLLLQSGGAVLIAGLVYAGVNWWQVSLAGLIALTVAFARLVPLVGAMQQQMHHWLHAVPALADLEDILVARRRGRPSPPKQRRRAVACRKPDRAGRYFAQSVPAAAQSARHPLACHTEPAA